MKKGKMTLFLLGVLFLLCFIVSQARAQYIYIGQDGLCGSKSLCFTSIQDGIDSVESVTVIEVTQETYNENIILDFDQVITLQGGWDTNFTSCLSYTTIQGSITITNGTMILENIIVANQIGYSLNVTVGVGGSTITKDPDKAVYTSGEQVQLTANAASGYTFANWTGDVPNPPNTSNPISITVDGNKDITANFIEQVCTSTVTAQVTNPAGGTITSTNPVTTTCGGPVTFSGAISSSYTGAMVSEGSLSLGTPPNWNWTGISAPMTSGGSKTVSVTFTTGTYALTVNVGTSGIVTVNGTTYTSPVSGLSGSVIVLAFPSTGYILNSWTTPSGTVTTNPYVFTISSNTTITANFVLSGPTTPCSTEGTSCSSQLAGSVSLNFPVCSSGTYGFANPVLPAYAGCSVAQTYTVMAGATVWFLVDASSVGKTSGSLRISVLDYKQGGTGGAPQAWIYPLDASNNLISSTAFRISGPPYQMSLPYGQGSSPSLPATTRYLLKVTEAGAGVPLMIIYQ